MCASPLSFLRAGPPPPSVVLLPDGLFFSRAVPIAPGTPAGDVAGQVELALEAISPFPLAQLYYGWYWVPGADHAFVYATYRRRFTSEQTATWADAELVVPMSAALLGGKVEPATTLLVGSADGITAIHWETASVPARVEFRPVAPEATEEDRARLRDELLRAFGGSRTVIDLLVPPVADPAHDDQEVVFRSGDFVSRLPAAAASALDVRDKAELAGLRSARQRDLIFWRVALGCAAALVLLLVGELALIGGNAWEKVQMAKLNGRAPTVQKIKEAQELANSIEDLVNKRLLPLEMLTAVLGTNAEKKPGDVVVTRITAGGSGQGLYTLVLEVQTNNPGQVPAYKAEIQKMQDLVQAVEVNPAGTANGLIKFQLKVTFKPGVLKREAA
jgi:hypothetical protein